MTNKNKAKVMEFFATLAIGGMGIVAEPELPTDHLTQYLLDEWTTLDLEERGKVIAYIGKLKAEKKTDASAMVGA